MRLNTFAYYADFFLSLALVAVLAVRLVMGGTWFNVAQWTLSLAGGIALWTLAEYTIHRWIYHRVPVFQKFHDEHHAKPAAMIGAPPAIGIALILVIVYAPALTVSIAVASGLTAGMLLGYMAYQLVHHASHFWRPAPGSYLYRTRLHHSLHHYHSEQGNYGITTAYWDEVFGTALKPRRQPSNA